VKFSNACSWAVYDVAGRKIANGYGNEVSLSGFKSGIYLVKSLRANKSIRVTVVK
ncbi:hypothetical protein DRQ20_05745, partial [bacterium]